VLIGPKSVAQPHCPASRTPQPRTRHPPQRHPRPAERGTPLTDTREWRRCMRVPRQTARCVPGARPCIAAPTTTDTQAALAPVAGARVSTFLRPRVRRSTPPSSSRTTGACTRCRSWSRRHAATTASSGPSTSCHGSVSTSCERSTQRSSYASSSSRCVAPALAPATDAAASPRRAAGDLRPRRHDRQGDRQPRQPRRQAQAARWSRGASRSPGHGRGSCVHASGPPTR
jgi:hypothetical protein